MSSTPSAIEISTPWEFIVKIHHLRTLSELRPHSPWAPLALSFNSTCILRELHPLPLTLVPLSCSWALAFLSPGVVRLSHSRFPLVFFAASLRACTVGNTLSPMLHTAGTTLRSRRKIFNQPRSSSSFASWPLEAAWFDMHTVTDTFYSYWVYPSSSPPVFVPFFRYSNHPLPCLATDCPFSFPEGSPQWQLSIMLSHCMLGVAGVVTIVPDYTCTRGYL